MHFTARKKDLLCPLCKNPASFLLHFRDRDYYRCSLCGGIFLDPADHLRPQEEKARYLEHNNDINDERYRRFVRPLTDAVLRDFDPEHSGLDFGAGTGPVITEVLRENAYSPEIYDPFFHPDPRLLTRHYDYIVCSEVIEHFHDPYKEFSRLAAMLKSGGVLYCMTELYKDDTDFANWYYKNDPTHVFFYHKDSLQWIKEKILPADLQTGDRLIVFRKF